MTRRGRSPTRRYITCSYLAKHDIRWDAAHGIEYAQFICREARKVTSTPENESLFNDIKRTYKPFNPSPWGNSKEALKKLRSVLRRRRSQES